MARAPKQKSRIDARALPEPEPEWASNWRPYKPPQQTVVPVRCGGRMAPDIYVENISLATGAKEKS